MIVTDQTLFPEDRCNPDRFSVEQRIFILGHLGETPRQAGILANDQTGEYEHPDLKMPVDVVVGRIVLQRFWEECTQADEGVNRAKKMRIRKYFMASLEGYRRTTEIRAAHGGVIDYSLIGIGRGVGETSTMQTFAFDLSSKNAPPKENWFADLIKNLEGDESLDLEDIEAKLGEALEKDVEDLVKEELARAEYAKEEEHEDDPSPDLMIGCAYCDWEPKEGDKNPVKSLTSHVRMGHRDRFEEYELTQRIVSGESPGDRATA